MTKRELLELLKPFDDDYTIEFEVEFKRENEFRSGDVHYVEFSEIKSWEFIDEIFIILN